MQVEHESHRHRFVVRLPHKEAVLTYRQPEEGVLDLLHTYVPPAARDQGVADALVEQALEYVREREMKIIPTCPFVSAWLSKHPEERDVSLR